MDDPKDEAEPFDDEVLDAMQGGATEDVSKDNLIKLLAQDEPHE